MKKIIFILGLIICFSSSYGQRFGAFNTWLDTYVNTNGTRAITGLIMNTGLKDINTNMVLMYYDNTRSYKQDSSIVLYQGYTYVCKTTISTPEAFNIAKWTKLDRWTTGAGAYMTADTSPNIGAYEAYYIDKNRYLHNSGGNFFNVFLGYNSGNYTMVGSGNSFVGYLGGKLISSGNYNTGTGWRTGQNITTGSNNTFLGYAAGDKISTQDGNIFIGYAAGSNATTTDELYIENSSSSSPLIWGSFALNEVDINGEFTATGDIIAEAGIEVGSVSAPVGDIALENDNAIRWENAASTTTLEMISLDGSNILNMYGGAATLTSAGLLKLNSALELGSTVATSGEIRLNKSGSIQARNTAGSANISLIRLNSDNVDLADGTIQITTSGDLTVTDTLDTDIIYTDDNLNITSDTTRFINGTDTLDIYHSGNKWMISSPDTIQIGDSSLCVTPSGDVCIDGNLVITGVLTAAGLTTSRASGYIADGDAAATTTTLADTYYFLKGTFTNVQAVDFGLDGDTLQYQGTEDIELQLEYDCSFSVGQVNTLVTVAISINDVVVEQSEMPRTIPSTSEQGAWGGNAIVSLSQNDKVKIIVKSNKAGGNVTAEKFSSILR